MDHTTTCARLDHAFLKIYHSIDDAMDVESRFSHKTAREVYRMILFDCRIHQAHNAIRDSVTSELDSI